MESFAEKEGDFRILGLRNEFVEIRIVPELGGRFIGLRDRLSECEWRDRPPGGALGEGKISTSVNLPVSPHRFDRTVTLDGPELKFSHSLTVRSNPQSLQQTPPSIPKSSCSPREKRSDGRFSSPSLPEFPPPTFTLPPQ
jgi:hypothetical protein